MNADFSSPFDPFIAFRSLPFYILMIINHKDGKMSRFFVKIDNNNNKILN